MEPDARGLAASAPAGTPRLFRRGAGGQSGGHGDRNHLWSAPRLDWHDARAPRASAAWYWHESDAPGLGVSARPRREVCQTRRDAGWPPALRKARLRFPRDIDALLAARGGRNSIFGKHSGEDAR